jgi:plastocyanin
VLRRTLLVAVAVLAALSVVACGDGDGGSPGPEDLDIDLPVGARVTVDEQGIRPEEVTVTAGELVEFTNAGGEEHRLVAEDHRFDTGGMRPGETFAFLAEKPGRITYRSADGPGRQTGAIVVEPAPGAGG